jgi:transposase
MKNYCLPKTKLDALRVAHKVARKKNEADRIKAVYLLGSGWAIKRVHEALLLDEDTLRNYMRNYEEGGLKQLLAKDYKGSESRLSEEQMDVLRKELDSAIYLTTKAVVSYVEKKFSIKYSQSGMRDLLHRIGYEYKKPKLVPGNPDYEAQEIFAQQYEEFMLTKADDVEVLFLDAVHPQHNTMAAYGWIKKGEIRELKTSSGRDRLNLHGAINAETFEMTVIESDTVDADSTIQLLEMLENKYAVASAIFVILDNARYHYSKTVQKFLETSRIKLVFLPSYSPNLNLIERVWKFFKKKVLYNTYYENIAGFRKACIHFFSNIGTYATELSAIMTGEFELA